jgi:3-carboxy-cis,cis-muconate cycloisomerase
MRANLDSGWGMFAAEALTTALAPKLGRHEAFSLVSTACDVAIQTERALRSVIGEQEAIRAVIADGDLDRIFDPAGYLGSADSFIDAALNHWRNETGPGGRE